MTLFDYIENVCDAFEGEDPVSIRFYNGSFNEDDGVEYEKDAFSILYGRAILIVDDTSFDMNVKGEMVNDTIFVFDHNGDRIGIELWF